MAEGVLKTPGSIDLTKDHNYLGALQKDGSNVLTEADITPQVKVIPQIGGGTLTAGNTNELRDGSTYTLPAAGSVEADVFITIDLPARYGAFTPSVVVSPLDTITGSDGADPDGQIDFVGSTKITLTSDGVSNWSI